MVIVAFHLFLQEDLQSQISAYEALQRKHQSVQQVNEEILRMKDRVENEYAHQQELREQLQSADKQIQELSRQLKEVNDAQHELTDTQLLLRDAHEANERLRRERDMLSEDSVRMQREWEQVTHVIMKSLTTDMLV